MARLCKGGWLDTYLEYTSTQESPTAFHEWIGISLIGAAVGRNIWIPRIKYTIYPNLFVILVAGSAKCRKSVSIHIGTSILKAVENPPMVFAQKITTEALIQALESTKYKGACSGLICASELSVFMGAESGRSSIIPALTDLYDSPREWIYHTRGRGKEVLKNVTISVLAASTKEWLKASIPEEAIGGGFTSRIIFVYQDRPARLILFPEDDTLDAEKKHRLLTDLSHIRNKINGPMAFTDQAKAVSKAWYESESTQSRDPKVDGYFARKHDTMFKVATVLSLAESDSREIRHGHINRALDMLEENEVNLEHVLASVVSSAVGGTTQKIFDLIRNAGVIKHSDLLRKCWRFCSSVDMAMHVKTLLEGKEILESVEGRTHYYEVAKGRR